MDEQGLREKMRYLWYMWMNSLNDTFHTEGEGEHVSSELCALFMRMTATSHLGSRCPQFINIEDFPSTCKIWRQLIRTSTWSCVPFSLLVGSHPNTNPRFKTRCGLNQSWIADSGPLDTLKSWGLLNCSIDNIYSVIKTCSRGNTDSGLK